MNTQTKPHLLRFHAFSLSLDVIRSVRGLVDDIRSHDASLAKQLSRAASSVSLNLAESRGRRGGDRTHLLRIALGSAEESAACLYVAQAWGYLDEPAIEAALGKLNHLLGMLGKLTR
jgi:four helix bundle protein